MNWIVCLFHFVFSDYRYHCHDHAVKEKRKKKLITFIETTIRTPYLVENKPIILHRNELNLMCETHVF